MQVKFVLLFGAFIGHLAGNAVITLIPTLQRDFDTSEFIVFLSITFYMVPFAVMQIFSGAVSDLFERPKVLAAGFYVYGIGSLICALAPNIIIFLVARILQGFGSAFALPIILAIIGDTVPFERRGEAMGILGSFAALGISTGPLIAGFFAVSIGWRWLFFLIFFLSLIIGTLFLASIKEMRKVNESKFDTDKLFNLVKKALSEKSVLLLGICTFLMFFCYIAALTFTSDFLDKEFSMKEDKIGLIIFSAGIAAVIVAPLAGKLADLIGRGKAASNGLIIMFTTFILLPFADSFTRFLIFFFLLGCGTGMARTALNTMAVELIPEERGTVVSLYNSFRFLGHAASPVLLAPIYLNLEIAYLYLVCAPIVLVSILIVSLLCKKCDACGRAFFENEIVLICEKDSAIIHGDIYNKCWLLHLEKEHDMPKKIEIVSLLRIKCDACGRAFFENEIVLICEKDGAIIHGDIYSKCWLLHLEKGHDMPKKIEAVFEEGRIISKEDEEDPK